MLRFFFGLWYLPIFFILTVISGLICLLTSLFSRRLARLITGQVWAIIVLRPAFIKVVVTGRENLPDPKKGGFIIFANHRSMLDIPTVAKASGLNCSWVAKAALSRIPIFGWVLLRTHMLVDRGGSVDAAKQMLTEATERLANGEIMAIFPEGTRNETADPLLPFKKGAFILAKHTGAPLIPLAIYHSGELWPKGAFVPKPGRVLVAIGKPLEGVEKASLASLAALAQKAMTDLYLTLENSERGPQNRLKPDDFGQGDIS
jgi:1-acyl-sn-glycerol-3-phosphate acyltransferase